MMAISTFAEQNLSTNNDKDHAPIAEKSGIPTINAAAFKYPSDDIAKKKREIYVCMYVSQQL